MVSKKEIEFLENSNWIEGEYSDTAMTDSIHAWNFAKRHRHMIDLDYIKYIHQELMINLNSRIAGKIRECPIYIGNSFRCKECLKPEKIVKALEYWFEIYSKVKEEFGIKESHIEFEKIHPFKDGNGRVGRIIMNIQRLNAGLPLLVIHEKEKIEYYKWFR